MASYLRGTSGGGNIFARFRNDSNRGIATSGDGKLFARLKRFFILTIYLCYALKSAFSLSVYCFTSFDNFAVTFNFFKFFIGEAVFQNWQREIDHLVWALLFSETND